MNQWKGPEDLVTIATLESRLHCPKCTAALAAEGFVSAFWESENIVYFCWCGHCHWQGDIVDLDRVVGIEAVEERTTRRTGRGRLAVV